MKTDWSFVIELLCIGLLSVTMLVTGQYVDMQAKRIDRLELEMESVISRKQVGGVTWEGKEDKDDTQTKKHFSEDWEYSTKIRYISAVDSRLSVRTKEEKKRTEKLLKDVLAITVLNIKNDRIVEKAIPTIVKATSLLTK